MKKKGGQTRMIEPKLLDGYGGNFGSRNCVLLQRQKKDLWLSESRAVGIGKGNGWNIIF